MADSEEILDGIEAGKIIIAETSAEEFQESSCKLVRGVESKGYTPVIITVNNPSKILKKLYVKNGIELANIHFIDAITKYALGTIPGDAENTSFINQPGNLTDIGIELNKKLTDLKDDRVCVILDSINTMLIYVPTPTMTKFIHFMSNKLRLMQCPGVYISIKDSIDPMLSTQLKSLSDEFLKF